MTAGRRRWRVRGLMVAAVLRCGALVPWRRDPSSGFPYVYTSPDAYTRLRATDEVFVLASLAHLPPRALA